MLENSALHEHSCYKHSGFQAALVVIMVMKKVTVTLQHDFIALRIKLLFTAHFCRLQYSLTPSKESSWMKKRRPPLKAPSPPLLCFTCPDMFCILVQFSSVTQSCTTLCHPMNRSMPGLPVHHQLPEFTQIYLFRVSDAIQPSHPLSSPSPPAPNPSQHQSLFQWVNSSHEVAKVLEFQL